MWKNNQATRKVLNFIRPFKNLYLKCGEGKYIFVISLNHYFLLLYFYMWNSNRVLWGILIFNYRFTADFITKLALLAVLFANSTRSINSINSPAAFYNVRRKRGVCGIWITLFAYKTNPPAKFIPRHVSALSLIPTDELSYKMTTPNECFNVRNIPLWTVDVLNGRALYLQYR